MDSKSQFYRSNGDGRDSYISFNNGGLFAATLPKPEYPVSSFIGRRVIRSRAGGSPQRTIRYHTNGSGRDIYISQNAGGFETKTLRLCPGAVFYKSLRDPEDLLRKTAASGDYLSLQSSWLPKRSLSVLKVRQKCQKVLVERLSKPRMPRSASTRK